MKRDMTVRFSEDKTGIEPAAEKDGRICAGAIEEGPL